MTAAITIFQAHTKQWMQIWFQRHTNSTSMRCVRGGGDVRLALVRWAPGPFCMFFFGAEADSRRGLICSEATSQATTVSTTPI